MTKNKTKTERVIIPKSGKTIEVVAPASNNKNSSKRSARSRRARGNMNSSLIANASAFHWDARMAAEVADPYLKTLLDPFLHGPVRLGFGTLIPTNTATLYVRGTVLTNATDGSFSIFLNPSGNSGANFGGVYTNNAGASTATYSRQAWVNQSVVQALGTETRVVSGGLRCLPLQALTAAPGQLFVGSLPCDNQSNLASWTPTQMSNHPLSQMGDGRNGCFVTVRPNDLDSFIFYNSNLLGAANSSNYTYNSIPFIGGLGFPLGITVYWEAVLNIEIIPGYAYTTTNFIGEEVIAEKSTVADFWPTPDSAWRALRSFMSDPVLLSASRAAVGDLSSGMAPQDVALKWLPTMFRAPKHTTHGKAKTLLGDDFKIIEHDEL